MEKNIAILKGDGIGPEIIKQTKKVLNIISKKFNHKLNYKEGLIGGIAIDKKNNVLPKETIEICLNSDAVILGAIGDFKYDNNKKYKINPEKGLLKLRKLMGVYCNVRPIKSYNALSKYSPIKDSIIKNIDFVIYRELTGGIYFGKKGRISKNIAYDNCTYSKKEIKRIAIKAFEASLRRKKKLTLVDKSNVLETSKLWRETIKEISLKYPEIKLDFLFIDNASMQIITNPKKFDVILTENMFGDILSDEASTISGSMGLLPSMSIGDNLAIFEPVHGSYPQAKGKNIANPIGSILSAAMMFDFFNLKKESQCIKNSIDYLIENNYCTIDINDSKEVIGTEKFGDLIVNFININY